MNKLLDLAVCTMLVSSCKLPSQPDTVVRVELAEANWHANHQQMVTRMNAWFGDGNAPELLGIEALRTRTIWYETPPSNGVTTCWHRGRETALGRLSYIEIPADLWGSSCVAHEIGHAALYAIDHPRYRDFEHEPH